MNWIGSSEVDKICSKDFECAGTVMAGTVPCYQGKLFGYADRCDAPRPPQSQSPVRPYISALEQFAAEFEAAGIRISTSRSQVMTLPWKRWGFFSGPVRSSSLSWRRSRIFVFVCGDRDLLSWILSWGKWQRFQFTGQYKFLPSTFSLWLWDLDIDQKNKFLDMCNVQFPL